MCGKYHRESVGDVPEEWAQAETHNEYYYQGTGITDL